MSILGYCKVSLASNFKNIMCCQINHSSVSITVGVVIVDVNVFSVLMCIFPLLSKCDGNY